MHIPLIITSKAVTQEHADTRAGRDQSLYKSGPHRGSRALEELTIYRCRKSKPIAREERVGGFDQFCLRRDVEP